MFTRLAAVLALVPALAAAAPITPSGTQSALAADIPALLAKNHVPSVSIAQIKHGRIVLVAAYGEQTAGAPATPASLYNIASLTKPLTAETLLRLASRGRLGLDEPVYGAWTDPDIAGDERNKLLTPRLLLSHQSGFPNWRNRQTGLAFKYTPGTAMGYSGEGYEYAARFAEKKLGAPLETLVQARLFGPVGMTRTAYTARPWFEGHIAAPADAGGAWLEPHIAKAANAADLVYTTPRDYAAFLLQVLKDEGLSPAIARERNRIQVSDRAASCQGARAAACPDDIGFGLGWQLLKFKDGTVMMHTGKDDGVFTFAWIDRRTGDGGVILTNGDNGGLLVLPILERLGVAADYLAFLKSQI